MQDAGTFVLEISRQEDLLKMSLFEPKDSSSTLKQYSQHRVDFGGVEKLSQEITGILNKASLQEAVSIRNLQKAGQALWDHTLSRSVKEKLKSSPTADLLLTIDEELVNIPWEYLYDGDVFLCLKFNLGRLVRTKSSATGQYRASSHVFRMLILANPTSDLKYAYLEGLNIRNQFDRKRSSIHIDFKSTNVDKTYIRKNLCDYDIIHFAGHCEYDPHNHKNSGWVLSDGKFSIHDILSMGQAASLPALVFSNACHSAGSTTGTIDDDYQKKYYSLAAAFLFSGVRHYIGSIRKIEDSASLAFAKEFYHNLILGKSAGESLRLSRLKLIKDYGLISLHWANYLLYGDPGFVLFKPKMKIVKTRVKPFLKLSKKLLAGLSVLAICAGIFIYLSANLATVNPSAYGLFLNSKTLSVKGKNEEVIRLAARIIEKDPNFMDIYRLLAETYYRLGNREKALENYFEYVLLAEKKRDFKRLSDGYIEIGWFYQLAGDFSKASDFYNKALYLSRKHNDKLNEAVAMRKLAVWHIDKKEYDLALELLTKSSEINRERQYLAEHRYNLACDYFDIGLVFSDRDDFKSAETFYRKSRLIFEKLKIKQGLSDYYFNLGELALFEKQYQKARDYYLEGLKIDEAQGNKMNLASDYSMIGELYLDMDRLPEAQHYLEQSVELAKQMNSQPDLAAAYRDLGMLYKKLKAKAKAKEYLRLAQEIYSLTDPLAYQEVKNEILSLDNVNFPK